MIKTCKTCRVEYPYESLEDLKKHFYLKRTKTGNYYLKDCKECVSRRKKEKYQSGDYNYSKRKFNHDEDTYRDAMGGIVYGSYKIRSNSLLSRLLYKFYDSFKIGGRRDDCDY